MRIKSYKIAYKQIVVLIKKLKYVDYSSMSATCERPSCRDGVPRRCGFRACRVVVGVPLEVALFVAAATGQVVHPELTGEVRDQTGASLDGMNRNVQIYCGLQVPNWCSHLDHLRNCIDSQLVNHRSVPARRPGTELTHDGSILGPYETARRINTH